jgi:hypothetical protein
MSGPTLSSMLRARWESTRSNWVCERIAIASAPAGKPQEYSMYFEDFSEDVCRERDRSCSRND